MESKLIFYVAFLLVLVVINSVKFGKTRSGLDLFQIVIYASAIIWYAILQGTNPLFYFVTSLFFLVSALIEFFQMGRINAENAKGTEILWSALSVVPIFFSILLMSGML